MNKLYISMYHYTRDLQNSRYPNIKGLDYSLFEEQLKFFRENFNVVTMEEVLDSYNGSELPSDALLLTFDDGYIDNFTVALPLLKKYGMQGSFFIPGRTITENVVLDVNKIHFILAENAPGEIKNDLLILLDKYRSENKYESNEELYQKYGKATRFDSADTIFIKRILQTVLPEDIRHIITDILFEKYVGISEECFSRELYMNRDQIRCLRDNGMFIGVHGYDHYWLGNLSEKQMKADIDRALSVMKEYIDINSWVMNYPYGNYNPSVIDYIKSKGCAMGITTEVRIADLSNDNRFMLPRLDCNDFPPKSIRYKELK